MQVPSELIDACKRGESGAFDELVRTTHRAVYSLVFRIVGNPDDAADVTQDVYLRVWRGMRGFRGDANAATWLYRIAANTALTFLRRRNRGGPTEQIEDVEVPVPDGTAQRDDAAMLEKALSVLPVQQRAVVVLKDIYGWSCEEIASEMGTTEGAIKVRLFRARQRLAEHLQGAGVVVPIAKRKKTS